MTSYKEGLSNLLSVPPSRISLDVVEGSLIVTASISYNLLSSANAALNLLKSTNATTFTQQLGFTILGTETLIGERPYTTPPPPLPTPVRKPLAILARIIVISMLSIAILWNFWQIVQQCMITESKEVDEEKAKVKVSMRPKADRSDVNIVDVYASNRIGILRRSRQTDDDLRV